MPGEHPPRNDDYARVLSPFGSNNTVAVTSASWRPSINSTVKRLPCLRQFNGEIGIHDVLLQREAIPAAANAAQDLAFVVDGFAAIDLCEVILAGQHKGTELASNAFLFPLDQRIASNEVAFVQVNAEAKSAFVGCFGDGDVGSKVAVSFFKTQAVQHFVPADLNAEFLASCHQQVKDHRGAVIRDVKFPTQFARITDTLSVHLRAVDVNRLGGQVWVRLIRDIVLRNLLQYTTRLWSPQRETGIFLRDVADGHFAVAFLDMHSNPRQIVADEARTCHRPEAIFRHAGDGQVRLDATVAVFRNWV